MEVMRRSTEAAVFFLALFIILLFQFRGMLSAGHYLYIAMIEDPGARLSWFPWDMLSARQLRAGHFPLWNPYSGTGMPLLANMHSTLFFPLKALYYIFPSPRALDLMVILRIALAGTFTFLFCRSIGLSRLGAAVGGFCFGLSGYMMKYMNVVHINNEMWLPLVFLLIHTQRRSRHSLSIMAGSALVWALVLIGGNPEAAFYVAFLGLFFSIALGAGKADFWGWMARSFIAPFILGGMVASAQLLCFFEYLGPGWHIHDAGLHLVGRHPIKLISSLIAPWLLGPSGSHHDQLISASYLGVVTLTLALIAAVHSRGRTRLTFFFIGAVAVLLSLVYYLPPLGFISWLPPFNRSGNAKFAMAGVTFFTAMLAGSGIDIIRSGIGDRRLNSVALALPAILVLGGALHARFRVEQLLFFGFLIPFSFLLFTGLGIVLSSLMPGLRKKFTITIAALCCLELLAHFTGLSIKSAMMPRMIEYREPALPEALVPMAKDPGLARFTGIDGVIHHNLNIIFQQSDLRAFEAMYPRRYVQAMGEVEGFSMEQAVENFFSHGWSFDVSPKNLEHPLVDIFGVKYVASEEEIHAKGFDLVREGTIKVYKNSEVYPRAWLEGGTDGQDRVMFKDYAWDRVEMEARGPGELVLADTFFPGWQAEVDGKATRIEAFRELFRSVRLGPGPHRVVMTYRPWSFRIGIWFSVFSLLGMIFIFVRKNLMEGTR